MTGFNMMLHLLFASFVLGTALAQEEDYVVSGPELSVTLDPVVGEEPPPGLILDLNYKKNGQAFVVSDAQKAMVNCVAQLARLDWNAYVQHFTCDPPGSTMHIVMRGSVGQPSIQTKHCIWTLRRLYEVWEFQERHYGETNIQVKSPEGAPMGFGQAYYKEPTAQSPSEALPSVADPNLGPSVNTGVPNERVNIKWYFYPSTTTAICNAGMYARIIIGFLTIIAELKATDTFRGDAGYYAPADITFVAAPSNVGQQETGELTVDRAITNLVLSSEVMATYDPIRDRFRAYHNKISLNGVNIMKSAMYKGRHQPQEKTFEIPEGDVLTAKARRRRSRK